jgi:hypothetical protein
MIHSLGIALLGEIKIRLEIKERIKLAIKVLRQ